MMAPMAISSSRYMAQQWEPSDVGRLLGASLDLDHVCITPAPKVGPGMNGAGTLS